MGGHITYRADNLNDGAWDMPVLAAAVALALISLGPSVSERWVADRPCGSSAYHQFDFWLGTWEIEQEILQADGSYARFPARNRVEYAASGCALVEHWRGIVQFYWERMDAPDSLYGLSVRSYDPDHHAWSIYWLDSRNATFGSPFIGGFDTGQGVFTRRVERPDGSVSLRRIVFQRTNAGGVEWVLEVSTDGGTQWTAVWRMHFTRAVGSGQRRGEREDRSSESHLQSSQGLEH